MKFEAWIEPAKFRTIPTGGSPILVSEGQTVAVVIVEKWDDLEQAFEAMRKLWKREDP